ncbi:M48 family metallopeptidase [Alkanindiges sp. WGS2144]|uniref:M48 family metallopeptidase n=1 Tax=Alkanindiges sp. WGS2144 TaxID=3366808 RepID=UPI00375132EE
MKIPAIQRRVKVNARRLKLHIAHHQIFLTTPPHTSEQKIQTFLQESENWLIQTWNKYYAPHMAEQAPYDGEKINLPLLGQSFAVHLCDTHSTASLAITDHQLIVHPAQAAHLLKRWVRDQAKAHLPQRLQQLAVQHSFGYSSCQVRHAKTRWGSCSARQAISLNAALILMPIELMDYVILHELCHTRQLNHSAKFWYEMQCVDKNYLNHRQQLKRFKLPSWWYTV